MKHTLSYVLLVLAATGINGAASAADVPKAVPQDARVRTIQYDSRNVAVVTVRRGAVTRVILEEGESIEVPVTGLTARCDNDADEWCIHAPRGASQFFVRPKDHATRTNMELRTNKRDYSFEFVVAGAKSPTNDAMFRVVFEYPTPKPLAPGVAADKMVSLLDANARLAVAAANNMPAVGGMSPEERLKLEPMHVENDNYTMQVLEKGADAKPSMVFDDGRFTYFEFLGAREVPAIFAYGSDGQPARVNWHMRGPFIVVQRLARKFTLRLGGAVVGVYNESFDSVGKDTNTSTVSPAVIREGR